jgi:hypothetical protein
LKTLCWKLGESFVKVSGKPDATYGKLWAEFKREEIVRNDSGKYAKAAAAELAIKKFKVIEARKILESGRLTDAHLHARSKRRAVKLFLAHYWSVGRKAAGLAVREPYAKTILGHDGIIPAIETE